MGQTLRITFICLLISWVKLGSAQEVDTTVVIDTIESDALITTKKRHRPGRAALYSAIIPGVGQIYNKSYLKLPFVYAGIGALVYRIGQQRTRYKCLEYAYRLELLDLKPNTLNCRGLELNLTNFNASGLRSRRDTFRKNMETAYIGLSLFYIAIIIDAYVDAHLKSFDVDEDLTINVTPIFEPDLLYTNIGLTFTLSF